MVEHETFLLFDFIDPSDKPIKQNIRNKKIKKRKQNIIKTCTLIKGLCKTYRVVKNRLWILKNAVRVNYIKKQLAETGRSTSCCRQTTQTVIKE